MLAEGLTSIQPLDQTIFTHNLESRIWTLFFCKQKPAFTAESNLESTKSKSFLLYLFRTEKQWQKFIHKKENISVSFSLIVSPFVQILIYFLIIWRETSLFFSSDQPNLLYILFYFRSWKSICLKQLSMCFLLFFY